MDGHLLSVTRDAKSVLIDLEKLRVLRLDLDLQLVPCAELVFDMLYFSEAFEDTSLHHDSNLCRQCFGLLH